MIANKYLEMCGLTGFDNENDILFAFLCQSDRLVLNYQAQKAANVQTDLTDAEYSELQVIRVQCINSLKGETNE